MSHSGPLAVLRDSLADIDRALLELLRRRMDLAAEVGRIKAEAGLEVVVRDVEDRVLGRARQQAEACGVSPEVMEGVYRAILQGSVERQYRGGIAMRQKRGERLLVRGGGGGSGASGCGASAGPAAWAPGSGASSRWRATRSTSSIPRWRECPPCPASSRSSWTSRTSTATPPSWSQP